MCLNCDSSAFSNAFKTCNKRWSGVCNAFFDKARTIYKKDSYQFWNALLETKKKITFSTKKHDFEIPKT